MIPDPLWSRSGAHPARHHAGLDVISTAFVIMTPNHPMQRPAPQRACARCFAAADRRRLDSCRGNGDVSTVMQKGWRRGAHVPWQALGHGCKGLPPQPMMFAKEEPLDDHHHYRL